MRKTSIIPDESDNFGVTAINPNDLVSGSTPRPSIVSRRGSRGFNKENLLIALLVLLSVIMAAFFVLT